MAAKAMSSFRFWIADDAEVLGSLKNAFELQAGVFLRAVSIIGVKGSSIRPQEYVVERLYESQAFESG
jgi:hypothetical protein